jgi:hypothetical protein
MFVFALRPMSACESLGEKAEGRRANTGLHAHRAGAPSEVDTVPLASTSQRAPLLPTRQR